jgi:proteasome lid subunit RPN8/RPN11
MAKKKTGRVSSKKREKIIMENVLPQNVLPIGEHVEEDKNIYISQSAYKEIHRFTRNKLTNESGGMLVGNVIEALGKTNIIIQGFVEAKYCEATPTTLTFTHETWDSVHSEIAERFEDGKIVGWIHTHPNFGIFLSEYDKFIQENFFKEEYQVAYVVDPIQKIEGFYFWINGRIEKCKGFYIFDKTGEKIELEQEKVAEDNDEGSVKNNNKFLVYALAGMLLVAVLVFGLICSNLFKRMQILETRQENLVESANRSIGNLQQQIGDLQTEMDTLSTSQDTLVESANKSLEAMQQKISTLQTGIEGLLEIFDLNPSSENESPNDEEHGAGVEDDVQQDDEGANNTDE